MAAQMPSTLLITHDGADLDGYASLVALRHVFPDAALVLSTALQDGVLEALRHAPPPLAVLKPEDIRGADIKRVVMADMHDLSRAGVWTHALPADVETWVFDHHPLAETRRQGKGEWRVEPVGATCTLVTEELLRRGTQPTVDDATLLLAGVYEDTGQLTFPSSTPRDFAAAHQLSLWGAKPQEAGALLQRLWDWRQDAAWAQMLETLTFAAWGNLTAAVCRVELPYFVPDVGTLAERYHAGDADVIFILAALPQKVFVIGRALRPDVSVEPILAALGGGGHAAASSAVLRETSPIEAEQRLLRLLQGDSGKPGRAAGELMSRPIISVESNRTLSEAHILLQGRRVRSLIVTENALPAGYVNAADIELGMRHGLGAETVANYAHKPVAVIAADTPLGKLRAALVASRERIFIVTEGGKAAGVITRKDITRAWFEDALPMGEPVARPATSRNFSKEIASQWGAAAGEHLRRLGEIAAAQNVGLYLVGGCVRDLIGRKNPADWDLVAEGDPSALYAELRNEGAVLKLHGRFQTAHVRYPDGIAFDLATARKEIYSKPGALPDVVPASLEEDLFRRDFSINAMAVSLAAGNYGELVDPFGGFIDLKHSLIRVLHALSMAEDPTRAFRAIRLGVRLGFEIVPQTMRLIERAASLGLFADSEGSRLRREIVMAFHEPEPLTVFHAFNKAGLLQACAPEFSLAAAEGSMVSALELAGWFRVQFGRDVEHADSFLGGSFTWYAPASRARKYLADFHFPESEIERIGLFLQGAHALEMAIGRLANARPSEMASLLVQHDETALLTWAALFPPRRSLLTTYLTRWVNARLAITGDDLATLGVPRGPAMGGWMRFLQAQLLDGQIAPDRGAQIEAVRSGLARGNSPP